jgi:hypothetical protein
MTAQFCQMLYTQELQIWNSANNNWIVNTFTFTLLYTYIWFTLLYTYIWFTLLYTYIWFTLLYTYIWFTLLYTYIWFTLLYTYIWFTLLYTYIWYCINMILSTYIPHVHVSPWLYDSLKMVLWEPKHVGLCGRLQTIREFPVHSVLGWSFYYIFEVKKSF